MATATKVTADTETKTVVIASAKVTQCIIEQVKAGITLISKKRATAEAIISESNRMGLKERSEITSMVRQSWLNAHGMEKSSDADKRAFELRAAPDIAKVIALAYPKDAKASKELTAAYQHNDALKDAPKQQRIGENKLLEIARGNLTFKQAIATKKAAKRNTDELDSVVAPYDRFRNSVTQLLFNFKVGSKDKLTEADARKAFDEAITAWLKPAPAKK
jgi:hypothetical protein